MAHEVTFLAKGRIRLNGRRYEAGETGKSLIDDLQTLLLCGAVSVMDSVESVQRGKASRAAKPAKSSR